MKLAIENLSPIPGKAIFWNNLHVVSRVTVLMASFLYVIGAIFNILPFDLPGWVLLIALAVGFFAQFHLSDPIAVGIALRRLRYSGIINFGRLPEDDKRKYAREWVTDIPERYRATLSWLAVVQPALDGALKNVPESSDRAMLFLGRDAEGNYSAKVYHSCDSKTCKDFPKHFRSYEEPRDGIVHWGGL